MVKGLPKLESARTLLRLADSDDVPAILYYYTENKVHLSPFEPLRPSAFYTESYWYEQVKQFLDEFSTDRSLKLFLFKKEDKSRIFGSINFSNFVRGVFQSCSLGYSVTAASQGRGYMTEALKVAISYVFTELNMHRVMASYLPHNQRSGRLLKRLGFVVEGYARDYLMINGQWQDHILTSLINQNWKPN
ncbi:MAG: ribosomal protein S5-alanine N-acetyltransferase [Cyanobacteriota bacterium]|nr:ribosomal protein S5-alanine N-acetyltransferase [Cyanobacteriota bacterium]